MVDGNGVGARKFLFFFFFLERGRRILGLRLGMFFKGWIFKAGSNCL